MSVEVLLAVVIQASLESHWQVADAVVIFKVVSIILYKPPPFKVNCFKVCSSLTYSELIVKVEHSDVHDTHFFSHACLLYPEVSLQLVHQLEPNYDLILYKSSVEISSTCL